MPLLMPGVFLIQATGHSTNRSPAETKAEEPIEYGFHDHPNWHDQAKDEAFGEVEDGGIILLYCTANVEACPKRIKHIFQVTGTEEDRQEGRELGVPNKLLLEELHRLSPGFPLENIRKWVEDETLSDAMNRAGTQGFNITRVEESTTKQLPSGLTAANRNHRSSITKRNSAPSLRTTVSG